MNRKFKEGDIICRIDQHPTRYNIGYYLYEDLGSIRGKYFDGNILWWSMENTRLATKEEIANVLAERIKNGNTNKS